MLTLLKIDASAQLEDRSLTRQLTTLFADTLREEASQVRMIARDVGRAPPPFVDHRFIHAAFTPAEQREPWMTGVLKPSDALIDEVLAADIIVMGAPMYNYGMPAALKAWFDQVARIGRTFSFDLDRGDFPIEPMLSGKKLVVLSSRGEFGFAEGGVRADSNMLDPAIAACAHYLGVARDGIQTVAIEYQEFKDERHRKSVETARERTVEIARHLAG
ncbi:FMN-dependent NADH-azoreductase [Alteriqipengyuania lutimaris]|uniref:FMN dependent NADH:quinone oxidoreductase n=1 Tax=Alteriqipengyuania lutimaris TaxID=1538146 RepID=A0A395LI13_9SPHN|nr:NAD(P)H-dependent oxidoreductase [Alteriqipengyuania lutimaris]MBB3034625.1 FMN-dependent NADH-azoreductase [Alteriqipengyuania lutimaris]RDS76502.1 FMN-dependent NADH-azoreductase [Alteriqipengyuania lutimaris]